MKKCLIACIFLFLLAFACNSEAGIFGLVDLKLFEQKHYKLGLRMDNDLRVLSGNQIEVKTALNSIINVQNQMSMDIKALGQMQIKAFAGLDKSIQQQAGGDIKTQSNSTIIFIAIIGVMGAIIIFLIRDDVAQRKWLENVIKSKDAYKQKYEAIQEIRNASPKNLS